MAHNKWTDKELDILKENYNKYSDEELTSLIPNHSADSIATKRRRLGLTKTQSFYTYDDVVKIFNSLGYEVLSTKDDYKNVNSPIKYYSNEYGNGSISLEHLYRRHNLSKVIKRKNYSDRKTMSKETIINEIKNISPNIEILTDFKYVKDEVNYVCVKHNYYGHHRIQNLLTGRGCKLCGYEKMSMTNSSSVGEFQNKVHSINPNINVIDDNIGRYGTHLYKCSKCNTVWSGIFTYTLTCPNCEKVKSHGEKYISSILSNLNLNFIPEKRFDNCKDNRSLPFDFYLPDQNICIEYNGEQHYKPIEHFGGEASFEKRCYHDEIKKQYCSLHGIKLIEIPYTINTEDDIKSFIIDNIK